MSSLNNSSFFAAKPDKTDHKRKCGNRNIQINIFTSDSRVKVLLPLHLWIHCSRYTVLQHSDIYNRTQVITTNVFFGTQKNQCLTLSDLIQWLWVVCVWRSFPVRQTIANCSRNCKVMVIISSTATFSLYVLHKFTYLLIYHSPEIRGWDNVYA